MDIECGGFTFISNFDSSNIDRVEQVSTQNSEESSENGIPLYEFNIWTKTDCAGTEFENSNRSWFYFGVKGGTPCSEIKLNVVNLNKQGKLYNQGMAPVYKVSSEPNRWERVHDRLSFDLKRNLLSFGYKTLENLCSTTYFAFTYPFSFTDLQSTLKQYDSQIKKLNISADLLETQADDIYYHRECLVKSLEGRPVELITVSSHHNITAIREPRLKGLFPDSNTFRPFQFKGKKVIFLSARVHPGETPSSFVMNGVLQVLLNPTDPAALILRKMYVFKLIPMLNPDGVSRGFYRTDTRGVNLNRFYLNPSESLHPSVFAARSMILYYHYGYEKKDNYKEEEISKIPESSEENLMECPDAELTGSYHVSDTEDLNDKVAEISMQEGEKLLPENTYEKDVCSTVEDTTKETCSMCGVAAPLPKLISSNTGDCSRKKLYKMRQFSRFKLETVKRSHESGLFLYIDFHGHASKKGIFMYGNHFDNISDKVECSLLPKLLSLNNPHFHYNQCNFSKKNMYTRDRRDGLSKEGCGRVAVLKYTGLIRSYTLECNYNTGCLVNIIPPTQRPLGKHIVPQILVPPKYTPQIYEEIGRALCISILDMTGNNPNSRLPASQYKSINGLKESLRGEALVVKSMQSQQNIKMRQGLSMLQRGNKNAGMNYASKRKLMLKKQSKNALFTEIASSSPETKENPTVRPTKSSRSTNNVLHPLNKCNLTSNIHVLKKKRKTKLVNEMQKKKIALRNKILGFKDGLWQNKGESSNWNANKRKIEKKLNPTGNASTSARPPKKRKKSKIM